MRGPSTQYRNAIVNTAKRAFQNRQRQIKDLLNLGSKHSDHVEGIKISRLNDLGAKGEGNPIHHLNKI